MPQPDAPRCDAPLPQLPEIRCTLEPGHAEPRHCARSERGVPIRWAATLTPTIVEAPDVGR